MLSLAKTCWATVRERRGDNVNGSRVVVPEPDHALALGVRDGGFSNEKRQMINARPRPLKFQKEDILRMEVMGLRALLCWDMGLGKTVATMGLLLRNPQAMPAVVICPAGVKYHWEAVAAKFGVRASVAEGQRPPDFSYGYDQQHEKLIIVNYDILPYWIDALKTFDLQTIIIDECQNLANPSSNRTMAAAALAKTTKFAIGLSGTPLMNRPAELWPTLNILRPDLWGSFWDYAEKYCKPRFFKGEWHYRGAENLPELHDELKAVMIRRRKTVVMKTIPPKTRHVIPMPLDDEQEYKEANDNFLLWLSKVARGKVRSAARAEKMVRVGYLLRLAAKLKMRSVVNWSNEFLKTTDQKLVLFAVHKDAISTLKDGCLAKSVIVDGSVTGRDRVAVINQFRQDPQTRLLIGNIKAAGIGTDGLQDVCSTCGFAEMWWVPAAHMQAEDRLYRIGQHHPTRAYYFVAAKTIEEHLCRVIQAKQSVLDETLDGADSNELNVFDELMRSLKQGRDAGGGTG